MEGEVLVVDNNSTDGSIGYLQPRFPGVKFIVNNENLGFARACNQALKMTSGRYVLFLNPDTIVPEDCLTRCVAFFEQEPLAGAIGIRMIDGTGRFLKESKRSFPSPLTSLFKLSGLARLFPHSPVFSRYHLGHLPEDKTHEVDVLAGAFMMVRKEVLDRTGGFDEVFFMYGEDVDLSYRIQELGYRNYYFAGSSIIHFKGESTKRGSMNYVRMFYNAMSIFVRKHYGRGRAGIFSLLIHIAIWIRAGMSAVGHFIRRLGLPLIDAGLILLSFLVVKAIWSTYVKTHTNYEDRLLSIAFPSFTAVYLLVAYYAGLYDRWYKRRRLVRSMAIATLVLLAAYSLLPENLRFSRGIVLFGAILTFILISLLRWILVKTGVLSAGRTSEEYADTLIAGNSAEFDATLQLMSDAGLKKKVLGRLAVDDDESGAVGRLEMLPDIMHTIPVHEVIFCQGALTFGKIIDGIPPLQQKLKIRIHAAGSRSIVGSDSKNTLGRAVSKENGYNIADPYNRRLKRLVDVCVAMLGWMLFPIHLFAIKKPLRFFANCFSVLTAQKTWIGYPPDDNKLPALRVPVLSTNGLPLSKRKGLPPESLTTLDYWYAKNYEPITDLKLILKGYRWLGEE